MNKDDELVLRILVQLGWEEGFNPTVMGGVQFTPEQFYEYNRCLRAAWTAGQEPVALVSISAYGIPKYDHYKRIFELPEGEHYLYSFPPDAAAEVEWLKAELSNREGLVCGDCPDGAGWLYNRVEGRHPCTCMTEAEPYQIMEQRAERSEAELATLRNAVIEECKIECDIRADAGFTDGNGRMVTRCRTVGEVYNAIDALKDKPIAKDNA